MKKSLLRDDLTLIGNRERLELSLHRAHYEYQRRQQAYAVLSLSIDNLEQINAKFGHSAGNEVFAAFVKRTARMLRNTDSFAQASGEDFVITLSHTDEACAIIIAQRLLDANRVNLVPCKEGAINYKLSVGIGNCMSGDLSATDILYRAQQSAVIAKCRGGDRVVAQAHAQERSKVVELKRDMQP